MEFKQYQPTLCPTYVREDEFKNKQEEAFGEMKDQVNESTLNAMYNGFVDTAFDDFALNSLGRNFNIDRSPLFNTEQWRQKLGKVWDFWNTSATPLRLITEIKEASGFTKVYILPQYLETLPGVFSKTIPVSDLNPVIESMGNFWSNFWVVVDLPHGYLPIKWGTPSAGKWGVGPSGIPLKWGGLSGNQDLLVYLTKVIKKLKPAWSMCRGIVFIFDAGAPLWGGPKYNDGTLWGWIPGSYGIYRILENWELPVSEE